MKENARIIKEMIVDNIRRSLTTEAESLKRLMDTVTSDTIEQVNKMKESRLEYLHSRDKTYQDYICYLKDVVKQFHVYLSSTKLQNNLLFLSLSDQTENPTHSTDHQTSPSNIYCWSIQQGGCHYTSG